MAGAMVLRLVHPTRPAGRIHGFSSIWAFYVTGFRPERHCQACFRGLRAPNFHSRNAMSGVDVILDRLDVSEVVYICGVARGPIQDRRHRNLHLPVRFEPGARAIATTYDGYAVTVEHAMALPIPSVPDHWNGLPPDHTRCRNFRFGMGYFRGPGA
jgi:hypothetical protein